jgi:hypothetical protein
MSEEEKILYDRKMKHRVSEFYKAMEEFKGIEKREKGRLSFAIEGKNGYGSPFDRILYRKWIHFIQCGQS